MPVSYRPVRHPVVCDECGEEFKSRTALDAHAKWLDAPESDQVIRHACSECGERFLRLSVMDSHRLRVHGVPEPVGGLDRRDPVLGCSACEFFVSTLGALAEHVERAHGRGLLRSERVPVDQVTRARLLASSRT